MAGEFGERGLLKALGANENANKVNGLAGT